MSNQNTELEKVGNKDVPAKQKHWVSVSLGVIGNFTTEALKKLWEGLPIMITYLWGYIAILQNISWFWVITVGVFFFAVLVFLTDKISLWIKKLKSKKEVEESNDLSIPPEEDKVEKVTKALETKHSAEIENLNTEHQEQIKLRQIEYENLESKQQEKLDEIKTLHEADIQQREASISEVIFLRERVRKERVSIDDYVTLSEFEIQDFRDEDVKTITFRFLIKNTSVFDITFDSKIEGYIQIRNIVLTGEKRFISTYEVAKSAGHKWFFIEQSLMPEKFDAIQKLKEDIKPHDFDLTHLVLTIKGADGFPQVEHRHIKLNRIYEKDYARIVSYKGKFKA